MQYNFEWDSSKANLNIRKHGVSFERAATIFSDQRAVSIFDEEHSHYEERWITAGIDSAGILVVVCHTFNQNTDGTVRIRIFSARKATKKEYKQYREG